MRGSVVRRGATYAVVLELDRDPLTGKRRQRWHSGYRTRREAEDACSKLVAQVAAGGYVTPTRQTVGEYLEEWLAAITPTIRESTHVCYRRALRKQVIPAIGAVPLSRLSGPMLSRLYGDLLASGLAPGTVRLTHTILTRAFRDAVRWDRLARTPTATADPPRRTTPETRTWDAPTLRHFLELVQASDDRLYALWVFFATTGVRRGEALGLRWADVSLDQGTASIRQTVIEVMGQPRLSSPKTAAGRRSIALDAGTVAVLRSWHRRQTTERVAIGPGYRDCGLVFTTAEGDPLHPRAVSGDFARRIDRWHLPVLSLHGLRHTHATLALSAGVHPRVVQDRLGHSNVAITLQTYSHVLPSLAAEAAERVARDILG
jgi:integrase